MPTRGGDYSWGIPARLFLDVDCRRCGGLRIGGALYFFHLVETAKDGGREPAWLVSRRLRVFCLEVYVDVDVAIVVAILQAAKARDSVENHDEHDDE